MKLRVAWVRSGGARSAAIEELAAQYAKRICAFATLDVQEFKSEAALINSSEKTGAKLVALDSRGRQYSSEEFARFIRRLRDAGAREAVFAVGPADGFSETARSAAAAVVSLGPMTLPHELARVVLLEQIYRAFTILARHPYHLGH
ncbi:MAG: 23S rRNA (pseudouridine(1915)-N(3))-methyltransferase RlmH [Acidobacteria bacterium]|nr:23S rRNA (pseudouridine(1915)-N(3))-methyltransferase RlmH [Acidobacteriota bacterium]